MRRIYISSPVGPLILEHDGEAVVSLRFYRGHGHAAEPVDALAHDRLGGQAAEQLQEYFTSGRREFDLPLRLPGTDFQRRVWRALERIPSGETRSYGEIALEVGSRGAARAIGQANARNPIPIIIPCHRVLASGGGIGGYTGDWGEGEGIVRKRWLLAHEGVISPGMPVPTPAPASGQ